MSKKGKIKSLINSYFDTRKNLYTAIQTMDSPLMGKLNSQKHGFVKELFNLLNDQEYEIISKNFVEIVDNRVPGCSTDNMKSYIKLSKNAQYFQCLESQKTAVEKIIDQNIRSKVTIVDHEDGISVCTGEYSNGECYPE